ncbi:MAG: pyridoxine 5'-phosphate synthase [Verrucomicrobiota bacterium]
MSESSPRSLKLGVNIDHVATLRQARYATMLDAPHSEPSLLAAAHEVEAAGADSITIHLRQDRRHIQDRDVFELSEKIHTLLNLEMGNTEEILEIALKVKPAFICLVPENRREITTEGGLDVVGSERELEKTVRALQDAGILVSLFVDPVPAQIAAAIRLRSDMVELHTGAFANSSLEGGEAEFQELKRAAVQAYEGGLQVNAGHGITLLNLPKVMRIPYLSELNVGHHLVSRSLFRGLSNTVREMLGMMSAYRNGEIFPETTESNRT